MQYYDDVICCLYWKPCEFCVGKVCLQGNSYTLQAWNEYAYRWILMHYRQERTVPCQLYAFMFGVPFYELILAIRAGKFWFIDLLMHCSDLIFFILLIFSCFLSLAKMLFNSHDLQAVVSLHVILTTATGMYPVSWF